MFREFGRSIGNAVLEGIGRTASRVQEARPLAADLLENQENYLVVIDTPGATTSDIQVRYSNEVIHVRVDRFRDHYEGFDMRFPGRGLALDGRVQLPRGAHVNPDAATATLRENGTLLVTVPKRANEDHRQRSASQQSGETEPEHIDIDDPTNRS